MVSRIELFSQSIDDALSISRAGARVFEITDLLGFSSIVKTSLGMITRDYLWTVSDALSNPIKFSTNLISVNGSYVLQISIKSSQSNSSLWRQDEPPCVLNIQITKNEQTIFIESPLLDQSFLPDETWIYETKKKLVQPTSRELQAEIVRKNTELQKLLDEAQNQKNEQNLVNQKLKEANAQLKIMRDREHKLARVDPTTGLASRTLFNERLSLLSESKNQFSVLYLDLDRFKSVNDSLGHAAGDAVLNVVGDRIQQSVRSKDTAARVGGDEFSILLPNTYCNANLRALAQRIIDRVSEPILFNNSKISVGVSVGIAKSTENISGEDLVKLADQAMFLAKKTGRGCFRFFSEELHEDDDLI